MELIVYTDASYCFHSDIAACGFVVVKDREIIKHEVIMVAGLKTPTNAEIFSIVSALQYSFLVVGVKGINLNTDCKPIVTARKKRKKFLEMYDTIDIIREYGIGVTINFVKGHSNNWYNNLIDKSCITQLRKYIKQNNEKNHHRNVLRSSNVNLLQQ